MTCPKCGRVHYFDSCPYCGFRATESQIVHDEPDAGDNYQPLQEKTYASPDRQPQTRRSNPPSQSPYIDYVYHDKPFLPQYDNDEFQPMYETSQPRQSKYSKILDEYESMEPIELPPKNRRKKPKKKATTIIICVIAVMVVIYLVAWATGNLKTSDPANSETESADVVSSLSSDSTESSSLIRHTEIIWKDDEKYGIVNLYLDGTKTKQSIMLSYYTEMQSYIEAIEIDQLKDYTFIEFVGNVVKDDLIECTIRGNLSIDYIKENQDSTVVELEDNITELFIPKPLQ